jgi:hypothetical protein
MLTRSSSRTLAANAAGIATALTFLAQEAEAAIVPFIPSSSPFTGTGSPYERITFNPMTSEVAIGYYGCANNHLNTLYSCANTGGGRFEKSVFWELNSRDGQEGVNQSANTSFAYGAQFTTANLHSGTNFAVMNTPIDGTHFYLGFGFRPEGSTGAYNLGWVELSHIPEAKLSVYQWAYESVPGDSIAMGVVPEPATSALIVGVAAASCLAARRYKAKKPGRV